MDISKEDIEKYRIKLRKLSNSSQYNKAYNLAAKLKIKYPKVLIFAYYEAVMTAEDDVHFTPEQVRKRYKEASKKFRYLLKRLRGADPNLRKSFRNEYYWFSKQPRKQYLLGIEEEKRKKNRRGAFYSQGVGAAMLSKNYAIQNKKSLSLKWAKKSEKAWINFFKLDSKWHNAYFFYAMALGFQDKLKAANQALMMAAKLSGHSKNWKAIKKEKAEIIRIHKILFES